MTTSTALVELEDVQFHYDPAGAGFRLEVEHLALERTRLTACIGPSGTGKTTLVHLIAGILVPHHGVVRLGGAPLSSRPDRQRRAERIRRIGMVFQSFELLPYLTAFENILLPYRLSPELGAARGQVERARMLAEAMGIADVVHRRPERLSQGERQRTAICRALITSPELILCDEPTGSLDPRTKATILDLLLDQARSHGATVLMVTHDHAILDRFDDVIRLDDGRVTGP